MKKIFIFILLLFSIKAFSQAVVISQPYNFQKYVLFQDSLAIKNLSFGTILGHIAYNKYGKLIKDTSTIDTTKIAFLNKANTFTQLQTLNSLTVNNTTTLSNASILDGFHFGNSAYFYVDQGYRIDIQPNMGSVGANFISSDDNDGHGFKFARNGQTGYADGAIYFRGDTILNSRGDTVLWSNSLKPLVPGNGLQTIHGTVDSVGIGGDVWQNTNINTHENNFNIGSNLPDGHNVSLTVQANTAFGGSAESSLSAGSSTGGSVLNAYASGINLYYTNNVSQIALTIDSSGINFNDPINSKGPEGAANYSARADSNTFIQKVYVDNAISTAISGGTGLITGTPTIAPGAGAGTVPTVSVTTNGKQLQVTVTTGTLPTGTNATIATVTLPNALSYTPYPTFSSPPGASSLLTGASMIGMTCTGPANVTITSGTTALTAATTYIWNINL